MKKTKKLLAMVLAMMMALSCMAMPAAAAHDDGHDHDCAVCSEDGIQPRVVVIPCPNCGGSATLCKDPITQEQYFKCRCGWSDNPNYSNL